MIEGNKFLEEGSYFHCSTGHWENTCSVCDSCDRCAEIEPCLEFLMFGTGPVTHNATFDKHNNFVCKNLVQKGEKVANKFLKWEK